MGDVPSAAGDRWDGEIRLADPYEGDRLRALAIAAKSTWGYDIAWLAEYFEDVHFSPQELRGKEIYVAEADGHAIAWSALWPTSAAVVLLTSLYVLPDWSRRGVGSQVFVHAVERAAELGATRLEWETDPHAVGFYEKMGGRYLRDSAPDGHGSVNPVMFVPASRDAALPSESDRFANPSY